MNCEDIYKENKHRFSTKAIQSIEAIKTKNLIYQYTEFAGGWQNREDTHWKQYRDVLFPTEKTPQDLFIDTIGRLFNIEPKYTRQIAQVKYFGIAIMDEAKREESLDRFAKEINFFAENDFIMGNLAELMEIKISYPEQSKQSSAIVSYLIFTDAGINYLNNIKSKFEIKDGETPKALED